MPSHLHEGLLRLFRNRPSLAPELLRDVLHVKLPAFTEARIESGSLSVLKSPEFRADLVVVLTLRDAAPVEGIAVEAQLARKARKRFVWPLYAAALRARFEIPVTVLVLTVNDSMARWASRTIAIGGGNTFTPLVIRLSSIPAVTDPARALEELELAVLSVMAHGRDKNVRRAARIVAARGRQRS